MARFEFDFHPRYGRFLKPLGVKPANSYVELTDDEFIAKFGRWKVRTPLSNITCYQVSGEYKWYRAIGIRGSMADHGLTFGSTTSQGVCVRFAEPIRPFVPFMPHHPGLTVTVADAAGLVAGLEARGIEMSSSAAASDS